MPRDVSGLTRTARGLDEDGPTRLRRPASHDEHDRGRQRDWREHGDSAEQDASCRERELEVAERVEDRLRERRVRLDGVEQDFERHLGAHGQRQLP